MKDGKIVHNTNAHMKAQHTKAFIQVMYRKSMKYDEYVALTRYSSAVIHLIVFLIVTLVRRRQRQPQR